jgi:ABC-2 type transport system ATP-binding protein
VGALLDARAVHPGRTAAGHLRALAATGGLPRRRVEEVLATVGLSDVAGRRTRGFSLGMLQRLGVAGAILGDPAVLLFDEPVNGLDPEGVRWMRRFLRGLAEQGRTVLVSSHLMAEMALTADRVVVIARGRLVADDPVARMLDRGGGRVCVAADPSTAPDVLAGFVGQLRRAGAHPQPAEPTPPGAPGELVVTGIDPVDVGRVAAGVGVALARLEARLPSLEEVFLDLTEGAGDFTTATDAAPSAPGSSR